MNKNELLFLVKQLFLYVKIFLQEELIMPPSANAFFPEGILFIYRISKSNILF